MPLDNPPPRLPAEPCNKIQKILIVDDSYENRYYLQFILEQNGYQTISVENGQEALEILKTEKIDAIITDILMPIMDGFKLCRVVKKDPKIAHIPFIFYTASYNEAQNKELSLSLGADEFITKPIEPEDFLAIIRRLVKSTEQGDAISPEKPQLDDLSYFTSYADALGRKLDDKVVESEHFKEEARFSEEKYRQFSKIHQGISYIYRVGENLPLSFEGQVEEMTGYPAIEFRNGMRQWHDIIHPDDKKRYLLEKDKAKSQSGKSFSMHYQIIHKNGETRWVHEIASIYSGTEPGVTLIQGVVYDNTPQIKSENQIRRSEEHFRFLFESMVEGVVFQDKNGLIIDTNPSAERILGLSRDQILGRESKDPRWRSIKEDYSDFPGEEHPAIVALMTGKKATAVMGIYNPQDDKYHWIFIKSVPLFQPGEETPYQVFTTFEDITGEQIAKNALSAREKQYRELVETVSDILFTLDKEGKFTYISPVVKSITGLDSTHFIGHHYLEFIHPDDHTKMEQWFKSIYDNHINPIEFRFFDIHKQILELRAKPNLIQADDNSGSISGIISEITSWKEAERLKTEHTKEIQSLLSLHLLTNVTEKQIFSFTLDAALDCTASRIGFIAFISNDREKLVLHIWSPEVMDSCTVKVAPNLFGMSSSRLWTECITTKKPVLINDFSILTDHPVYPEGHLQINRFLIVPILDGDQVKAIIAVANRTTPYTDVHANALNTLGNTLWEIIIRKRSEREIKAALTQISQNMEQLATLNDTIRNPLSVITLISDLVDKKYQKDLMEAVRNIDKMISRLDQGWIQSEKVRNFLIKHYQFKEEEF